LKTTGEGFKNDMSTLENKQVDDFIHEVHGDHHAEGSVKVAHH
jgi:hypothetical protein